MSTSLQWALDSIETDLELFIWVFIVAMIASNVTQIICKCQIVDAIESLEDSISENNKSVHNNNIGLDMKELINQQQRLINSLSDESLDDMSRRGIYRELVKIQYTIKELSN